MINCPEEIYGTGQTGEKIKSIFQGQDKTRP